MEKIMSTTKYDSKRFLDKRGSPDVSYEQEQNYIPIPGTTVRVLLEFPQYNIDGKSAIIQLDDVMTISFSSHRVKAPVTTLGQVSVTGFGLGTRMVAGSIIRSIFTTDNLTALQSKIFLEDQENIEKRLLGLDKELPSGLPMKDQISIIQDDLTSFNIHIYSISEYTMQLGETPTPRERFDTIIGATITNTGQVYSIEDLISEGTISFQAKAFRSSTNITDYTRGYGENTAFPSISSLFTDVSKSAYTPKNLNTK